MESLQHLGYDVTHVTVGIQEGRRRTGVAIGGVGRGRRHRHVRRRGSKVPLGSGSRPPTPHTTAEGLDLGAEEVAKS